MNALAIFVKYPEKGKVKTRLGKSIGDKKALELYMAFLEDLLKEHSNQNYDLYVYVTPAEKVKAFEKKFQAPNYVAQRGENIGMRIFNCIKELLGLYEKVVVVASDVPTLRSEVVNDAFFHIDRTDVVVGPAPDGGYYLIGMKDIHDIFSDIADWNDTKKILAETIKIAEKKKIGLTLLKPLVDIDTLSDLEKLKEELKNDNESATGRLLKKIKV